MAFFEKLGTLAKNITDKTTDALEMGTLDTQIAQNKGAIRQEYEKMGEKYFLMYTQGMDLTVQLKDHCEKIKELNIAIEKAQEEIKKIEAEAEQRAEEQRIARQAEKEARAAAKEAEKAAEAAAKEAARAAAVVATEAAVENVSVTDAPPALEPVVEAPVVEAPVVEEAPVIEDVVIKPSCPNCGYENPVGSKFCGECGTKL